MAANLPAFTRQQMFEEMKPGLRVFYKGTGFPYRYLLEGYNDMVEAATTDTCAILDAP